MSTFLSILLMEFTLKEYSTIFSVLDSMPIVTFSRKCFGKVLSTITDKGYCSAKSICYYEMKLHALNFL
jgi:hypothetical protein